MPHAQCYKYERLTKHHDRSGFFCGISSLDTYLKERANQDFARGLSVPFVMTEYNSNMVIGYYTLSNASINPTALPEEFARKLPYKDIGVTLLGRFAANKNYTEHLEQQSGKKPGLGELLLMDAQYRTLQASKEATGSFALVVDVIQPTNTELAQGVRDPLGFYLKYSFIPLTADPRRLFKPMKTIAQEFRVVHH